MEKKLRQLLEDLNSIVLYPDTTTKGEFKLDLIEGQHVTSTTDLGNNPDGSLNYIYAYITYTDGRTSESLTFMVKKYEYPKGNIEFREKFLKYLYIDFLRFMLFARRCEYNTDRDGSTIRCIPIADLIRYGLEEPKFE